MKPTAHINKSYRYAQGGAVRPADDEDAPDVTMRSRYMPEWMDRLPDARSFGITGNPFASGDEVNEANRRRVRAEKERNKQMPSRRDR